MLVGEIPSGLSNIKGLKSLLLGGNHLTWNNNATLEPKFMLSELSLKSCVLQEKFQTGFLRRRLKILDLSENQLEGMFPQWLAEIEVAYIILSDNNLTGSLPPFLFNSNNLVVLSLSRNNFHGELPSNIGEIPTNFSHHTRILALGKNNFSGNLSKNLINLSKLEYLDIHDNKITGEFPNFIFQISTLRTLNLRNNSLHGSIPNYISNFTNIQILDLSNNYLVGEIPAKFGNLVGMTGTTIKFPYLSDYIPFNYDIFYKQKNIDGVTMIWKKSNQDLSLDRLEIYNLLDLSMNKLSGEIPASLGNLKALKVLNISHNNLYGRLPTSLGCLENLESLDLSHNNLSSSILQSLTKFQQFTILDVSNNKLTGKILVGSQMDTMDDPSFYANNNGLCGMQIRVPCLEDLPPTKPPRIENKDTWFSWEGVEIGYAIGFFVTVGILYLTNSFVPTEPPNYRHQQRRQRV
ncbi:hypothetical protein ACJW31_08G159100 [Castanea mollissima]